MALDTRAAAARVLCQVLEGNSLNQALPPALEQVDPRDRGLLQQLCYGSLRQAPRLQAILKQLLDKPLRDKDLDIQGLLLCGLYQLEETRIPDHAAVSATVAATQALKKPWAKGLSNAVLRRFLRDRDALMEGLGESSRAAHPRWLYKALKREWPEQADAVIQCNNTQPPMTLRVNSAKTSREDYLQQLADAGIDARPGQLSSEAIYLASPMDVNDLPGFAQGWVSVQDEAAQMAAELLDAKAGERILDACAAPGGKTCHILERQPDLGEMIAMDLDPLRLARVEENLERLELQAALLAGDAANPPEQLAPESFDAILVDAPCSASGVIRRHPDVKLLRRREDIAALGDQQLDILQGLWPLLKPGGRLLYATCSVLIAENREVIRRFADNDTVNVIPMTAGWGENCDPGQQLLPSQDGQDGLYYCMLQKS